MHSKGPNLCPTYEEVSSRFGFPVPKDYYRFLRLSFRISPQNPWEAFGPLLLYTKSTPAHPSWKGRWDDYADTLRN